MPLTISNQHVKDFRECCRNARFQVLVACRAHAAAHEHFSWAGRGQRVEALQRLANYFGRQGHVRQRERHAIWGA